MDKNKKKKAAKKRLGKKAMKHVKGGVVWDGSDTEIKGSFPKGGTTVR